MSIRLTSRFLLRTAPAHFKLNPLLNSFTCQIVEDKTENAFPSRNLKSNYVFPSSSRFMSTLSMEIPTVKDPQVEKAVGALLASSWLEIEGNITADVEKTLNSTSDETGKEILDSAWRSAQAVEEFLQKLTHLRMELDHLSGGKFGGETVGGVPKLLQEAMDSALQRYFKYLNAFGEDEYWLKKKVEHEIGTALLQIKQRCTGLSPEWNKVSLLGTSGISGSFIEFRAK